MTKKPRREKKSKKKKKPAKKKPRSSRRRARIKPIEGPFQIELPLQMPLFLLEPSVAPASLTDEKNATPTEARARPDADGPAPSQPALFESTEAPSTRARRRVNDVESATESWSRNFASDEGDEPDQ
jgi:hypothetical protein